MGTHAANRSTPAPRGRAIVLWGLAFIGCGQLAALYLLPEPWREALQNPAANAPAPAVTAPATPTTDAGPAYRLPGRPRQAEQRPLVWVLGSSRVACGVCPEAVPPAGPGSAGVELRNCGVLGAGAVLQLRALQELLGQGRPADWVLVEYWAPFWEEGLRTEIFREDSTVKEFKDTWMRGWISELPAPFDPHLNKDAVTGWRAILRPHFQKFRPSTAADRAVRRILDTCRDRQIATALLYMPENSEIQSWYPLILRSEVDRYLIRLSEQYRAPLIDARHWVPDEQFYEGFHLRASGARTFTARLVREVLQPLLAGQGAEELTPWVGVPGGAPTASTAGQQADRGS